MWRRLCSIGQEWGCRAQGDLRGSILKGEIPFFAGTSPPLARASPPEQKTPPFKSRRLIGDEVMHIAANLSAVVLWLGQEFGPSAAPLLVAGPDVGDTNIQEAGNLMGVRRGTKRHGGFIVGGAATDVHNQPTIGKLDDGGFTAA